MERSTMKEEQKVSFIHSISAKIMLLTVLAVVMSVLIVAFRAEAGAKKVVGDVSADYILSMAEMGVEIVNNLPQEADAGAYENALADISMEGIDSSYAYLVDTDGTMLYHPTAEKIGQPVENAVAVSYTHLRLLPGTAIRRHAAACRNCTGNGSESRGHSF